MPPLRYLDRLIYLTRCNAMLHGYLQVNKVEFTMGPEVPITPNALLRELHARLNGPLFSACRYQILRVESGGISISHMEGN